MRDEDFEELKRELTEQVRRDAMVFWAVEAVLQFGFAILDGFDGYFLADQSVCGHPVYYPVTRVEVRRRLRRHGDGYGEAAAYEFCGATVGLDAPGRLPMVPGRLCDGRGVPVTGQLVPAPKRPEQCREGCYYFDLAAADATLLSDTPVVVEANP